MLMQVNITKLNPKTISKKTCNMHYIGQRINVDPKLNDLGPKLK
jgi:hypothetical protein